MNSNLDIYRTAKFLIDQHGDDAPNPLFYRKEIVK